MGSSVGRLGHSIGVAMTTCVGRNLEKEESMQINNLSIGYGTIQSRSIFYSEIPLNLLVSAKRVASFQREDFKQHFKGLRSGRSDFRG